MILIRSAFIIFAFTIGSGFGFVHESCAGSAAAVTPSEIKVPVITSEHLVELSFGEEIVYELAALNDPLGFSVKDLPFWLVREKDRLVGRAISVGEYAVTLTALNNYGVGEPFILKIKVTEEIAPIN